jgi:ATP-dependent exoDNAse (exonuclease V) beta subunit
MVRYFKQDDEIQPNVLDGQRAQGPGKADLDVRAREGTMRRMEIDFNRFLHTIMPAISSSQKVSEARQLSASAVFREILSYIKGSHLALAKETGRLSREEYLKLPTKMAPNFKGLSQTETLEDMPAERRGTRDLLYDLYEAYEYEKRRAGAYDISDVVHHIWRQLQEEGYRGVGIDSILVDETQDFTQAELRLFISICSDKNDMFFCGDTCQTIASGVGFRFEDLKCIFKTERDKQIQTNELQTEGVSKKLISVPKLNTLTLNYRTHNGILSAAAGVVDLLEFFFPSSIDFLEREKGFFDGPKPVLLTETNVDDAAVLIVGSDKQSSQIEFGAHQVILLRNQDAKVAY